VIPRRELTDFKTSEGSINGQQNPIISLYWVCDDTPTKTIISLPSSRLFNLFGRYIQSTLRLETGEQTQRQQSVRLLLVDDDPDDLEMAELFLKRQSDRFSIIGATSAAGGLEYLAENGNFDCVVSDFSMPGMDGIEFLREVRERYPDLPFILYTGQGSEQIAKRAIIDDVTDYVEKDIGTNQYAILADRIWKAIR
jgi:CheY-like chemotaxis protein